VTQPNIAIILGTTREGRFGDKPAQWLLDIAARSGDANYEIVDLRNYPLPFFDDVMSPMFGPSPKPEVARWAAKLAEFDGYVFVTAEYNHSVSGVLKNALDSVYPELNRKPAAFLGYGGVGGARAVEQLRLITVELQMVPLKHAVHIGMVEFLGIWRQGKSFADYPHLEDAANTLLGDLAWWTEALKTARTKVLEAA
jgi:NAD(P)H-dependent FMN reductase